MILYGFHALEAALSSGYRVDSVHLLGSREKSGRVDALKKTLRQNRIEIKEYIEKRDFHSALSRAGAKADEMESAQGVFAMVADFDYADFHELLEKLSDKKNAVLLFLDSITDPQNLGSILRSAAFFGVDGVVTMDRRAAPITAVALKISSGGFIHVPVAQVGNLVQALEAAKEKGFWVYGLSEHGEGSFAGQDFSSPVALVIGNEEKGIRTLVEKTCDVVLALPVQGKLASLNAAVAAAVTLALVRDRQSN
jgi:23S rRNA (guanosine2251-2'-O)-methyltransferase